MADSAPKSYSTDPALYLYTSLTAGSSHIVTATSRLETILRANRIPFKAIDLATDEKARMLWGRRAGKDESGRARKIPGLVQEGMVVGDLVEIEDWNEYGELKQHVKIVGVSSTPARPITTTSSAPSKPPVPQEDKKSEPAPAAEAPKAPEPSKASESSDSPPSSSAAPISLALRQLGQEAAEKAKDIKKKAAETRSGVGKAEPAKEAEKSATPAPVTAAVSDPSTEKGPVNADTILQSPTSSAWRRAPESLSRPTTPRYLSDKLESLQSPTSTAWKPTDIDRPILSHRGSSISLASAEEIKQVEQDQAIPEEDEEEDEEDEEEDEEDSDEEEDSEEDAKDKKN
ncbi:uncharacterized protein BP5553_02669 [Venustampulla echinocandica]|uniref:Uncharacterized protein n=1 Tax=Venustampulla echinocandica TaxID=2656787 RepID=A0A370TS13_9HELO|nr:uncharacterized protein BP5553_02669 [Venustampulla echinocandica]RDL38329.1 hypothetical protein BP5553_02669 [Venustampulla echinocandica]